MNTTLVAHETGELQYLQGLLDRTSAGITHLEAIRNGNGQITDFLFRYLNSSGARLWSDYSPGDVIGKRWTEVVSASLSNTLFPLLVRVIDTRIAADHEQPFPSSERTSWFALNLSPQGNGLLITSNSITPPKQDSQQVQQPEKLQAILDAMQTSIHMLRPAYNDAGELTDFVFTAANPAFAQYTGTEPSAFIGQTVSQWFPGYKSSGLFARYKQVFETGSTQRFETHYNEDGLNIWTDAQVSRLGDEIIITHTDFTALKQAELERKQQTDQLKFVTDSALTAIALYSIVRDPVTNEVVDLRYELINERASEMTRRNAEELVGHTMREVFPGIEQSGIWVKYKALAETGEPLRFHNRYVFDGYDLWYEVQGVRKDNHIVLSFLDITELKKTQEYNEQQAEEFRQVLDNALTAISHFTAVRDENGTIVDFVYQSFNRISEQITGMKAEEIVGRRMLELFPGVRTSGVFERWVKLVESGETIRFQDYYEFDGFNFWFDTQAVKWGDGFIQSYIDISLIKQAELAQQKQAELLNAVLNATQTAVCCCPAIRDEHGKIIDFGFSLANQQLLDGLAMTAEQLYTKTLCEISPALASRSALSEYINVVDTGGTLSMERPVRGRWYYMSVVKFGDGILVSLVDITENHQNRQKVEAANAELRRSNENLESFAYVASHDLQEPLRKIESFGDLLKSEYAAVLGNQGADIVNRMQQASQRMSALIRDLLSYSRLATQKQPFRPLELNQIISDVLNDLETTIIQKRARVEIGTLPTLSGDERQLRQLFQNLLSNALKFSKAEGTIPHIRVTCQPIAATDLSGEVLSLLPQTEKSAPKRHRQFWSISVADNGIGFDQKYAERIFGAFQRLHGRQQYPGTGIGLAIVKKVAENHGGTVIADGRTGEGATFTVYLPQ